MKKTIVITIESVKNKDLKEIQKAKEAIRTLSEFARNMRRTTEGYAIPTLEVKATTKKEVDLQENDPAFAYFYMDVDVDGLEEVLEKIGKTTEQLNTQLQELTGKIYTGLTNEKPQE